MKIKDLNSFFVLTLGYGRSGSTMIGHILNQHPNCLMSTEFKFLNKYVKNKTREEVLLKELINAAQKEYKFGSKKLSNKHQKDIIIPSIKYSKDKIRVVGDKKSGGNTSIFIKDSKFTEKFIKTNENLKFIINLRNPYNIMCSCRKSKNFNGASAYYSINENSSDLEIFKDILYYQNYCINFYKKYKNRCLLIYYDDVINNTDEILRSLFSFLEVDIFPSLNYLVHTTKKEDLTMPENYENELKIVINKENLHYLNRYIK